MGVGPKSERALGCPPARYACTAARSPTCRLGQPGRQNDFGHTELWQNSVLSLQFFFPLVLSHQAQRNNLALTTATFSSSVHRARALPSALRTLRGCSVAPARAMTAEVTAAEVAALEAELAGMALPPVGTEVRSRGCTPALPCALLRRLLPSLPAG